MQSAPTNAIAAAIDQPLLAQMLGDAKENRLGAGKCEHPWRSPSEEQCGDCAANHAQVERYERLAGQLQAAANDTRARSLAQDVVERAREHLTAIEEGFRERETRSHLYAAIDRLDGAPAPAATTIAEYAEANESPAFEGEMTVTFRDPHGNVVEAFDVDGGWAVADLQREVGGFVTAMLAGGLACTVEVTAGPETAAPAGYVVATGEGELLFEREQDAENYLVAWGYDQEGVEVEAAYAITPEQAKDMIGDGDRAGE